MRAPLVALLAAMLLLAGCAKKQERAAEQQPERSPAKTQPVPAGWQVRMDRPDTSAADVEFVNMPPGWHITTGPAAILYNPQNTAAGEYRIESESFLFPGEHLEGYGLLFGGQNLDAANQTYAYFLLRRDGKFIVKVREGDATRTLIPWTEHAAIGKQTGEESARNAMAVEAGAEKITFYVNGQKVAELPRRALPADGIVGLRVNHHLNVHVTRLQVTSSNATREFAPQAP